jgi:hypothetical protein
LPPVLASEGARSGGKSVREVLERRFAGVRRELALAPTDSPAAD